MPKFGPGVVAKLQNDKVRSLKLEGPLAYGQLVELCGALKGNTSCKKLDLDGCYIGPNCADGLVQLSEMLRVNRSLEELDLQNNGLDLQMESAIVGQCADIVCGSHLRELRLGGNPHLSDQFVRAMISAVAERSTNPNLETINLGHFPIDDPKLLKVLDVTIERSHHAAERGVPRFTSPREAGHAPASARAAKFRRLEGETPLSQRDAAATPAISGGWRRRTPASAAVSPPQTAPRGGRLRAAHPRPAAASVRPKPPAVCRPPARPGALPPGKAAVHVVSLSRLSPGGAAAVEAAASAAAAAAAAAAVAALPPPSCTG